MSGNYKLFHKNSKTKLPCSKLNMAKTTAAQLVTLYKLGYKVEGNNEHKNSKARIILDAYLEKTS
jgi:hypothetical protein